MNLSKLYNGIDIFKILYDTYGLTEQQCELIMEINDTKFLPDSAKFTAIDRVLNNNYTVEDFTDDIASHGLFAFPGITTVVKNYGGSYA